jgi:hypothetical protein
MACFVELRRITILICIIFLISLSIIVNSAEYKEQLVGKSVVQNRSFTVDYERGVFLKDGEPFQYISGSFHYFRTVEDNWDDIFRKMKLGGLDAIQT